MTSALTPKTSAKAGDLAGVSKQLTAEEVADVLRIGPYQVIKLCREGRLPASKPGKSWLIDPESVRDYLAEHSNQRHQESA
jgi:excisionase family DNA binding protein